jgi:hypothetical protein
MKFGDLMEGIVQKSIELQLTPPYLAIWIRVAIYWKNNGFKPVSLTREQLAKQLSISTRTAQRAIQKLETIGAIEVERMLKLPSKYKVCSQLFKGDIKGDKCDKSRETRRETNQGRQSDVSPSTSLVSTNLASTKLNQPNLARVGHSTNNVSNNCRQSPQKEKPKRLSMWVLKNRKDFPNVRFFFVLFMFPTSQGLRTAT